MGNTVLGPEDYDQVEAKALELVPNRVIEATRAIAFGQEGYPIRVATLRGLRRYVDVMHEHRTEDTFRDILLGGITPGELSLIRRVTEVVCELTETRFGRRMAATGSLLRALNVVRQIRIIHPNPDAVVFEIGHGSGYVGALLLAAGYGYASTDIAQAFYVYQSHLLDSIAPGKLIDLAADPRGIEDIDQITPGTALHVPWWKYFSPRPEAQAIADVATCSHALAEMHPNSLSYAVKYSRSLLKPGSGAFLFEGWGSTIHTPIWGVAKKFADHGYAIAHNDTQASVFVPKDGVFARGARTLPLPPQAGPTAGKAPRRSLFGRSSGETAGQPATVQPDPADIYHPPIHITPENELSARLTKGRSALIPEATVHLTEVLDTIRQVLGRDDLESDDEAFMSYLDVRY